MYPKNLIICHLNKHKKQSFKETRETNKFLSLQQTVLSETIILLCETKIEESFSDSQFFTEGLKMYHKGRTTNEGGLLLYRKLGAK